ncbi:MAG: DUF4156 domain-containing protein [Elusimicrobiaceae bacterium]|nr:DUF4156 domain-containing protein [Elusimicrobiaceae bacterium]
MKKISCFLLCVFAFLSGCVLRMNQAPQVDSAAAAAVQIVSVEPQGCEFLAGVTGDQNGGEPGHFKWEKSVTERVQTDLKNNAAKLGGNVVYIRNAYMGAPDRSDDFYSPFYINGVQYNGMIYKCP